MSPLSRLPVPGARQPRARDEAEKEEEQTGPPRGPSRPLAGQRKERARPQAWSSSARQLWIQLPPDWGRCCYARLSPQAGPGW